MCGIAGGSWTTGGHELSSEILDRMIARIEHRGPDDSGVYRDSNAALGFRRLSIIDLNTGHQPLSNENGTIWVVFNGEIYNYPSLRRRLEATGHTLRTESDTEVLVHLYEDKGVDMFPLLRGMFALAIWDSIDRRLIIARDRLGQKPLVYHYDSQRLVFASELKALLALPSEELARSVDPVALDQYLAYGYVPHPRTILKNVHKLPPAHYAVWEKGRLSMNRYWTPDFDREDTNRPLKETIEELRSTLSDAVQEQMIADVPLGAFLSGGIDSTIIVGLMQKVSQQPVKTFSIGFEDSAFDESHYAELAASHLKTDHHCFRLQPKAWDTIPELAKQFDEPFADSSALPTWHVSRETRQHVTVALTGDAGDELFGGYDRYRALGWMNKLDQGLSPKTRRLIAGPLQRLIPGSSRAKTRGRAIKRLLETASDSVVKRYARWSWIYQEADRSSVYSESWINELSRATRQSPEEADPISILERAFIPGEKRDVLTQAAIADMLLYLPDDLLHKVDMASMAHSLECRGPFLDHRVVELALKIPTKHKRAFGYGSKAVLKRAFPELLPRAIRKRSKMGFGVPIDRWFRNELKDDLQSILLDPSSLDRGFFQPEVVQQLVNDHIEGKRDHAYRLWALLMLELWFRQYG